MVFNRELALHIWKNALHNRHGRRLEQLATSVSMCRPYTTKDRIAVHFLLKISSHLDESHLPILLKLMLLFTLLANATITRLPRNLNTSREPSRSFFLKKPSALYQLG